MYFDCDHGEREDIRFLVGRPLVQDLRRSPPCGKTMMKRVALHGIQVLIDRGKGKIRDACMTRVVHEDV